ncbi:MAG: hypothetical protein LUE17_00590 [Planctomycetaceae bacterium]|nr:hypothetical protein [Planctomycetaceae bacterium]
MNMYFSMNFFSGAWNSDNGSGQGVMMQSQFASRISGVLDASSGSMADLSQSFLGMGMSVSGFQQSSSGLSLKLVQSRNLLNELLELLQNRKPVVPMPEPAEEETEDAAEAAEAGESVEGTEAVEATEGAEATVQQ